MGNSSSSTLKAEQLFKAAKTGDRSSLQALLAAGGAAATVDLLESKHEWRACTPLHAAASMARIGCLSDLLKAGATVNAADKYGCTPLHLAAWVGAEVCVSQLLKAGANVNAADKEGWTALHRATAEGDEACASLLLKAGATVDAADNNGCTPLHNAAWKNAEACVSVLLKAGANVDAVDTEDWTPLHRAAAEGHVPCVSLLLKAGAKLAGPASYGSTHSLAHEGGHTAVVAMLQDQARWQRRRALALIKEQREAGSDWRKARKVWRHSR